MIVVSLLFSPCYLAKHISTVVKIKKNYTKTYNLSHESSFEGSTKLIQTMLTFVQNWIDYENIFVAMVVLFLPLKSVCEMLNFLFKP